MKHRFAWKKSLALVALALSCQTEAYTVAAGKIYNDAGQQIQLKGVNWFGFETSNLVVHGLWSRGYKEQIQQMKTLGFNAVRLPFCPATLQSRTPNGIDFSKNPDLVGLNSLQVFDRVIQEMTNQGLYVLLDHHRPDCNAISELWYIGGYSEAQWIADLQFVADRYKANSRVFGIDLKNEPHGSATWGTGNASTDWNKAAERASAAVLAKNPRLLVFVEGIGENPSCSGQIGHFWGGNLEPLNCTPLSIPSNKLVLSPHVYGPDVFAQPYFNASNFPANMPAIWEAHFGQFVQKGYTVVPGEFGGKYGEGDPKDKVWQDALVNWFVQKGINNFFYWSWNPNSGDTGGILKDDWVSVREDKMILLRKLMGSTGTGGGGGTVSDPGEAGKVCLYEHTNYTGGKVCYGEGSFNLSASWINKASSVRVSQGLKAELFDAVNLQGTRLETTADTASLVVKSFNDRADSVRVSKVSTGGTGGTGTNASCDVTYKITNQWSGGFTADVTVANRSSSAINGWTVNWNWTTTGQQLAEIWNATGSQSGTLVTAKNASWNAAIPAGSGQVNFGFNGRFSGSNPVPTNFKLNGQTCTVK